MGEPTDVDADRPLQLLSDEYRILCTARAAATTATTCATTYPRLSRSTPQTSVDSRGKADADACISCFFPASLDSQVPDEAVSQCKPILQVCRVNKEKYSHCGMMLHSSSRRRKQLCQSWHLHRPTLAFVCLYKEDALEGAAPTKPVVCASSLWQTTR